MVERSKQADGRPSFNDVEFRDPNSPVVMDRKDNDI
jgi:hypothetical protein